MGGRKTDTTDKTDWGEIQDTHKSYGPHKPHERVMQTRCPKWCVPTMDPSIPRLPMTPRLRKQNAGQVSKMRVQGVQNGCLGGLCSVITGIGKRLRRSAPLQREANITCRTGVQNEGAGVQNGCLGGLCSVITGIGKRLRRSATLQREANITCRTGVQNVGTGCPECL